MYETVSASKHYTNDGISTHEDTIRLYVQRYVNMYATFVDEEFDEQSDDAVSHYTDYLCRTFVEHPDDDADYAANNALAFAHRVCEHLMPADSPPIINLAHYNKTLVERLGTTTSQEAKRDTMLFDSARYLCENPLVDALVDEYIDAIDPTGDWVELARAVAGLAFLQFELSADELHEQYIQRQLKKLEQDLTDFEQS